MLTKRIIPCLDVKDGRTVKGINFEGLADVGDPVALGERYALEGADELVYLDISATREGRGTFTRLVSRVADRVNIPFTVGGGISSLDDAAALLDAGADKISINSAAVRDPQLISDIARRYGSQFVVVAIDAAAEPTESGMSPPTEARASPTDSCFPGPRKRRSAEPARYSSPPWITTAPARATPATSTVGSPHRSPSPS